MKYKVKADDTLEHLGHMELELMTAILKPC